VNDAGLGLAAHNRAEDASVLCHSPPLVFPKRNMLPRRQIRCAHPGEFRAPHQAAPQLHHDSRTHNRVRIRARRSVKGPSVHGSEGLPEFLPRVFDRFARAEAGRTSDGSGLGPAFVHPVATAHGGTAHVDNAGHGAAVTLRLPC
jgi:hypothetical protein